jgi:DNA-binding PadR family transcriptional regulator
MAKRRKVGNLLALALLSLLAQQPMYPYEMAQTLRTRGKDKSIKINWGSLYTVVQNLEKYGLIEVASTEREGRQPERTTYRITEAGRAELLDWLRELLSVPDEVPVPFEAALSEATFLHPAEFTRLLTRRLASLEEANARDEASLATWAKQLPRLLLIEVEYQLAMRLAEANWVRELLADVADDTIGGVDAWRRFHETGEVPPELAELDEQAKRGWGQAGQADHPDQPR